MILTKTRNSTMAGAAAVALAGAAAGLTLLATPAEAATCRYQDPSDGVFFSYECAEGNPYQVSPPAPVTQPPAPAPEPTRAPAPVVTTKPPAPKPVVTKKPVKTVAPVATKAPAPRVTVKPAAPVSTPPVKAPTPVVSVKGTATTFKPTAPTATPTKVAPVAKATLAPVGARPEVVSPVEPTPAAPPVEIVNTGIQAPVRDTSDGPLVPLGVAALLGVALAGAGGGYLVYRKRTS